LTNVDDAIVPSARGYEVRSYEEGIDFVRRRGWTDGHPVVLPTEEKVVAWLEELGADAALTVAGSRARNRLITLEHVVINAIMAGCRPVDVPLIVAAIRATLTEEFQHNHLASLGGPWPFYVVSGPVVDELGLNFDQYVMGPGSPVNSTIARAISLVFWNCLEQRPGGVQRGQYGAAWRLESIIAERQRGPWTQLNVDRSGFGPEVSTVTAFPATDFEQVLVHLLDTPERILAPMIDSLATGRFVWGPYILVFPPNMVAVFERDGWSKPDIADYVRKHTRRSVADLKRRTRWAEQQAGRRTWEELIDVEPEDEATFVYLFQEQPPEYYDVAFRDKFLDSRESELMIIDSGGDSGPCAYILIPYTESGPITITLPVEPLPPIGS
jgi:hypothetical protein